MPPRSRLTPPPSAPAVESKQAGPKPKLIAPPGSTRQGGGPRSSRLTPLPGSAAPAKPKHPGGVIGLLGAVGEVLSAPQQAAFRVIEGAGKIGHGDVVGGLSSLGHGAGAITDAVGISSDWGGDHITPTQTLKPFGVRKLPKGLDTGLSLVADPLNLATFGTGTAAKKVIETAAKDVSEAAARRLAEQGLKKGLTEAEQATLKTALVRGAEEAGSKNATKTADKLLSKAATRARGGIGAHIPFTEKGATLIPGTAFEKAGAATGITAAKDFVKASAPVRALRRGFVPGAAVAEAVGKPASEEVLSAGSRRFANEATTAADLTTRLKAGVKSFEEAAGRKFTPEDDAFVHWALEGGEHTMSAAIKHQPAMETLLRAGDDIRRQITAEQLRAGVLDVEHIRDDASYLRRLITPEAQAAFKTAEREAVRGGRSVSGALKQGAAQARTLAPDATVSQINEAIGAIHAGRSVADAELGKAVHSIAQRLAPGEKLFQESAVRSLAERGHEAARAIAAADYVKDLRSIVDDTGHGILFSSDDIARRAAEFGVNSADAVPHGWTSIELPKLGTFHAPPEIAAEVKRFVATIGAEDAVSKFDQMLRRWDRWWKVQVTSSLPGGIPFALRNARSNLWMMFADSMPAHYLAEGRALQRDVAEVLASHADDVAREGVEPVLARELSEREWKLYDAARREGIIGTGFYQHDVDALLGTKPQLSGGKVKAAIRNVAGTEGFAAQKGLALNSAVEEHARLSHFLYSVDRLGSIEKAADRTKAVLFDYARLTPLEQNRIKRIVPFYTFMRKNVPATFARFIENPARVALPEKVSRLSTEALPEDAPEYQKRMGSRLLKFGPLKGLVSTPERPLQSAVAALEPLSQTAAAILPGKQGGLEPENGLGQAARSLLAPVGGGPIGAAKALAQEAAGKNLFTGYTLAEHEEAKRIMAAAYPTLGRFPTLTARLPTAEKRRKDRQDRQMTIAEAAQILGIKLEPQTSPPGTKHRVASGASPSLSGSGKRLTPAPGSTSKQGGPRSSR